MKRTPSLDRFAALAAVFLALTALGFGQIGVFALGIDANPPEANTLAQQVIELTNAERAAQGLPPLKLQTDLQNAAMWIAQDNADYNYFNHTDRLGRSIEQRFPAFGYADYSSIGENLHAGSTTASGAVSGWMNSPGHRANILGASFCEIGAGYGYNASSTYQRYWSQTFGCRFNVYPVIINREAAQTTSASVSLYIYGSDWAQQMRLSNDGVTWTAWEAYQPNYAWTLAAGSGTRTVYVELRNGTTVRRADDSILLSSSTANPTSTRTSTTPTATRVPLVQSPSTVPIKSYWVALPLIASNTAPRAIPTPRRPTPTATPRRTAMQNPEHSTAPPNHLITV